VETTDELPTIWHARQFVALEELPIPPHVVAVVNVVTADELLLLSRPGRRPPSCQAPPSPAVHAARRVGGA
jgi:hypothetical protein